MLEQHLARRQQLHASRGAGEQLHAELVLEAADAAGQRRLGDVQTSRGPADMLLLGDGDERLQLRERHRIPRNTRAPIGAMQNRYWTGRPSRRSLECVAIVIHGPAEIEGMRRAGATAAATLAYIGSRICAGVTTADIDAWVREDTARRGARPSQLGYRGFPATCCTSRNHVVCHGIPSPHERLEDGDIVNVDVTSELDGFHGDTSVTFRIGTPSREADLVVELARRGMEAGIAVVRPGARLGDIGAAIEEVVRPHGCSLVRELGGHGIGRRMHMAPHVDHVGRRGTGLQLRAGMTFTIEPMVTVGSPEIRILDDGWTVVTADGSPSAQFEHTVLVTADGHEVLTRAP